MNKMVTLDFARATTVASSTVQAHPQALLELPHGEARQSLLTVPSIL